MQAVRGGNVVRADVRPGPFQLLNFGPGSKRFAGPKPGTIRLRLFEPDVDPGDRLLSKLALAPIGVPELARRNCSTGTSRPHASLGVKSAGRLPCGHSRPERV